jgi:hypothetical protein
MLQMNSTLLEEATENAMGDDIHQSSHIGFSTPLTIVKTGDALVRLR